MAELFPKHQSRRLIVNNVNWASHFLKRFYGIGDEDLIILSQTLKEIKSLQTLDITFRK